MILNMQTTVRRQFRQFLLAIADKLWPPTDALTPPRTLQALVGGGDFKQIGDSWLQRLITYGGLKASDHVLDVGCGVGRIAIPLASYLTSGSYEGFDVMPSAIDWCHRQITPHFPQFHFHRADIYNGFYNSTSRVTASEYQFSYPNEHFDFILATSVFTHLLPEDSNQYLAEIARVLKPQGRCLLSFFLLNERTRQAMVSGRSNMQFQHITGIYQVFDRSVSEFAVAYDEEWVLARYGYHGLKIIEPIHYGSWSGRVGSVSRQDFIVAVKDGYK